MNKKYDNLTVLQATGDLNWITDPINAYLQSGTVFNAADVKLSETGGILVNYVPVSGRRVDANGSLLGNPASFNRVGKGQPYQVVIAKDDGYGDPLVLAFYDEDEDGDPLMLKNNGTLIVRPALFSTESDQPTLGVWVAT